MIKLEIVFIRNPKKIDKRVYCDMCKLSVLQKNFNRHCLSQKKY